MLSLHLGPLGLIIILHEICLYFFRVEYECGRGIIMIVVEERKGNVFIVLLRFGVLLVAALLFACAE